MRPAFLAAALLCAAVNTAAQSHEPAVKPAPVLPAPGVPAGITATHAAAPGAGSAGSGSRPLVSRIQPFLKAAPTPTPKAAGQHADGGGHETTSASPATPRPKPLVSGAAGPSTSHGDGHGVPAAPATRPPAVKGPVKLATVHGRLTAALAEGRQALEAAPNDGNPHGAAKAPAAGDRAPAAPRYLLTWPKERWRVSWPAADRVVVAWPE